ncbi:MAG TPA: DUF3078 domain-containing protein [bacterium]|nr:DUF3078 domain-containing protein [bacterium]
MRYFLTAFISMGLLWSAAFGQEEKEPAYGWRHQSVANLNFTDNNFDNWEQGGADSWSWQLEVPFKFVNIQKGFEWSNSGKVAFGKTKVGDQRARKASDVIKFESLYTQKLGVYVNPYVAVSGQTQLAKGYKYTADTSRVISGFMDPGYFTQSLGVGYSPRENIRVRLGAALKETITDQFPVPYADNPETETVETFKFEYGADTVTDVSLQLRDNLLFTSKVSLFSNLQRFDEIDVDWDNTFTAKVSKYLIVSLNIQIFYDKDISRRRQLKQTLAVGFSYSLL